MAKNKILNRLRNNLKASLKALRNQRVQDLIYQVLSLLAGILIALILNNIEPLSYNTELFSLLLILVFIIGIYAWSSGYFVLVRILLIGASIVSVLSALLTWISTGETGLIQITLTQIDGIFRSILLASYFSLLDRLTKFIEDRVEKITVGVSEVKMN